MERTSLLKKSSSTSRRVVAAVCGLFAVSALIALVYSSKSDGPVGLAAVDSDKIAGQALAMDPLKALNLNNDDLDDSDYLNPSQVNIYVNGGSVSGGATKPPYVPPSYGVPGVNGRDGAQGVSGSDGQPGRPGMPGAPGPRGLPGSNGPAGPVGRSGSMGPAGPIGKAGTKGAPGSRGPRGPAGPRGPRGRVGPRGQTGRAGVPGRAQKGPAGPRGPRGPTGPRGRVGPAGAPGPIGKAGPRGPKGVVGPRGVQGKTGPAGPVGPRGPMGVRGPLGPRGDRGPAGPVGPIGPRGDRGPVGPRGQTGPRGDRGAVGPMGPRGLVGPKGVKGDTGPRGPAGDRKGCDGIPGSGLRVDICGVCGGDESTCGVLYSWEYRTCHAVGDPHFRTFDGLFYDWQYTGNFILAKHNDDFVVQNDQRLCPNPNVRCNKGISIWIDGNIILYRSDWEPNHILLNGRDVYLRWACSWQQLVQGNNGKWPTWWYGCNNFFFVWSNAVQVRSYYWWWGGQRFMDVYIDAPGRWSSGRTMSGLCGNYNNNPNDDAGVIWPTSRWDVSNSATNMFRNPKPTTFRQSLNDFSKLLETGDFQSLKAKNRELEFKVDIKWDNETLHKLAREACGEIPCPKEYKSCMEDISLGRSIASVSKDMMETCATDHTRQVVNTKCLDIPNTDLDKRTFAANISAWDVKEGITYSFYLKMIDDFDTGKRNIFKRGSQLSVDAVPANNNVYLEATLNGKTLRTVKRLEKDVITYFALVVSDEDMKWMRDYQFENSGVALGTLPAPTDSKLVIGASDPKFKGKIARFNTILFGINRDVNKMYEMTDHRIEC